MEFSETLISAKQLEETSQFDIVAPRERECPNNRDHKLRNSIETRISLIHINFSICKSEKKKYLHKFDHGRFVLQ